MGRANKRNLKRDDDDVIRQLVEEVHELRKQMEELNKLASPLLRSNAHQRHYIQQLKSRIHGLKQVIQEYENYIVKTK